MGILRDAQKTQTTHNYTRQKLTALLLPVGRAVSSTLTVGRGPGGLAVAAVTLLAVGLAALLGVALCRLGWVRPVSKPEI